VLGICDFRHKTPRQSHLSLTPAKRDRLGPSKIPLRGEGPGFSGQNKDYWIIPISLYSIIDELVKSQI